VREIAAALNSDVLATGDTGAQVSRPAGQSPASTAATVALVAGNGDTVATEPVERGYYLVYAPVDQAAGNLVFYDAHGQVVDELAISRP